MPTRNESSLVADDEKVAEVVVAVDEKVSVADDEKVVAAADELALVAAWRELADRHARITWALERSLHEQHRLGVSEFEVLERLAEPDKDQPRMQELAKAGHLNQSAAPRRCTYATMSSACSGSCGGAPASSE